MKPIEDLKMEHEAVKITLRILESICNETDKAGEIANPEYLEQLMEFFKTFVDRCHHGKEEELCFRPWKQSASARKVGQSV